MTLPTYRPAATCPKCGEGAVSATYVPGGREYRCQKLQCDEQGAGRVDCGFVTCRGGCREEHLHRSCSRCQFAWPEAVLSPGVGMATR